MLRLRPAFTAMALASGVLAGHLAFAQQDDPHASDNRSSAVSKYLEQFTQADPRSLEACKGIVPEQLAESYGEGNTYQFGGVWDLHPERSGAPSGWSCMASAEFVRNGEVVGVDRIQIVRLASGDLLLITPGKYR